MVIVSFLVFLVYFCGCDTDLRAVQESEELMVNVAATINNLSFYQAESSVLRNSELTIAKCKTERLTHLYVGIYNQIRVSYLYFFALVLHFSMPSPLLSSARSFFVLQWCWSWCSAPVWMPCLKPLVCMATCHSPRMYETLSCRTKVNNGQTHTISIWDSCGSRHVWISG